MSYITNMDANTQLDGLVIGNPLLYGNGTSNSDGSIVEGHDPKEHHNVLFPNTWVAKAASRPLTEHLASLKKYPPIKPGTLDPYVPKRPQ